MAPPLVIGDSRPVMKTSGDYRYLENLSRDPGSLLGTLARAGSSINTLGHNFIGNKVVGAKES